MDGKRKLTANLTVIKETLSAGIEPVCDRLIEQDIIQWETKDELDAIPGSQKKVDHILKRVISGGPEAYKAFIEILGMCGYPDLADTIENTRISARRVDSVDDANAVSSPLSLKLTGISLTQTDSEACAQETAHVSPKDLMKMVKPIKDMIAREFETFKEEQRKTNTAMLEAQHDLHRQVSQEHHEKLNSVMDRMEKLEKSKNEKEKQTDEYKALREECDAVTEKMNTIRARLANQKKDAHGLKDELSQTKQDKDRIEGEFIAAKKELEAKETKLKEAEKKLANTERKYNELDQELQHAKKDLEHEMSRNNELQKYIEPILRVESFIKGESIDYFKGTDGI